jgi:hypothetical protein
VTSNERSRYGRNFCDLENERLKENLDLEAISLATAEARLFGQGAVAAERTPPAFWRSVKRGSTAPQL